MKNYTLITGCTSGIGKSLAYVFASKKHNLILVSRTEDKLNKLKEELIEKYNIDVFIICKDLLNSGVGKEIFEIITINKLNIDILVNNAGIGMYGEFLETDILKINNIIDLNIKTLVELSYHFGNFFKAKLEGTIINIASTGAFVPGPYMSCYYASKAFVLSFSEALSLELSKYNINVCCVCPGPTKTEFFEKSCDGKYDLLKNVKYMDSMDVANFIYDSYLKKKVVAIPGFKNKLGIFATRFISRKMTRNILLNIQEKRFK